MTVRDCVLKLLADPYYEDTAVGFIQEAVITAAIEHGPFETFEDLDRYIKENLI